MLWQLKFEDTVWNLPLYKVSLQQLLNLSQIGCSWRISKEREKKGCRLLSLSVRGTAMCLGQWKAEKRIESRSIVWRRVRGSWGAEEKRSVWVRARQRGTRGKPETPATVLLGASRSTEPAEPHYDQSLQAQQQQWRLSEWLWPGGAQQQPAAATGSTAGIQPGHGGLQGHVPYHGLRGDWVRTAL